MMRLSQAAEVTNGSLLCADRVFDDVVIDSREVKMRSLFVAIQGRHNDGHDFIAAAQQQGAVASLVSQSEKHKAVIEVEDTTIALGALAHYWRDNFNIPVAGITGSNGKTTVTHMVAQILNIVGVCLSPKGSFNNQWGVPLTLLGLRDSFDYAAIEMGMNHVGEINYLSSIAKPTVALINNIGPAHLEGLGSKQAIAMTKAEIFSSMSTSGIAIINRDDCFSTLIEQQAKKFVGEGNIIGFSVNGKAEVGLQNLQTTTAGHQFDLLIENLRQTVILAVPGMHNVMNALAASAVAWCMGATLPQIAQGLHNFSGVSGRLNILQGINQSIVIDDSYNANPSSVKAAIDVLSSYDRRSILVLGEMVELGEYSADFYSDVSNYAKKQGVDSLYCLQAQKNTDLYVQGFGQGAVAFDHLFSLLEKLRTTLDEQTIVLVKGSRLAQMERVVAHIVDEDNRHTRRGESC